MLGKDCMIFPFITRKCDEKPYADAGITVRDYVAFHSTAAASALASKLGVLSGAWAGEVAKTSYEIADALLSEGQKSRYPDAVAVICSDWKGLYVNGCLIGGSRGKPSVKWLNAICGFAKVREADEEWWDGQPDLPDSLADVKFRKDDK